MALKLPSEITRCAAGVAAKVLGITPRQLLNLTNSGVLQQSAKGKYDLTKAAPAYRVYCERGKVASEMSEARLGAEQEKRRKLRLDNDEREKRLLPAPDVEVAINEGAAIMATHLEALPSRLAGELAGMTDAGKIKQRLKDEIRDIRNSVADRFEMLGAIHVSRGDGEATAGSGAGPVGGRQQGDARGKR